MHRDSIADKSCRFVAANPRFDTHPRTRGFTRSDFQQERDTVMIVSEQSELHLVI
jgi:hypothetical protein